MHHGPNITDLLQGEHPEILTGIGEGIEKRLSAYESSNISETQQDRTKVTTEDQWSRLVPKSTTSDDL